jgi:hypothetical protein
LLLQKSLGAAGWEKVNALCPTGTCCHLIAVIAGYFNVMKMSISGIHLVIFLIVMSISFVRWQLSPKGCGSAHAGIVDVISDRRQKFTPQRQPSQLVFPAEKF